MSPARDPSGFEYDYRILSLPGSGTRFLRRNLGCAWHHILDYSRTKNDDLVRDFKIVRAVRDPVAVLVTLANFNEQPGLTRKISDGMWRDFVSYEAGPRLIDFRVDAPEDERAAEVAALEAFLGHDLPDFSWDRHAEDETPDTTGAKQALKTGEPNVVLQAAEQFCMDRPWLLDFYRPLGYLGG